MERGAAGGDRASLAISQSCRTFPTPACSGFGKRRCLLLAERWQMEETMTREGNLLFQPTLDSRQLLTMILEKRETKWWIPRSLQLSA